MTPKGNVVSMLLLQAIRNAAAASRSARSAAAAAARAARRVAAGEERGALRSRPSARCLPQGQSTLTTIPSAATTTPLAPPDQERSQSMEPRTPAVVYKNEFVAEEKDMDSDEALWALYERWCKHFKQERSREEMAHHFDEFKTGVLRVHKVNSSGLSYTLAINNRTDGKLACCGGPRRTPMLSAEAAAMVKALGGLEKEMGRCFAET